MSGADHLSARRLALRAAVDALPTKEDLLSTGCLPVTGAQWCRSVLDADLENRLAEYLVARVQFTSILKNDDHDLAGNLRPAAINAAGAAHKACDALEILAVLDPGDSGPSKVADRWRGLVAQDVHELVTAGSDCIEPPPHPAWLAFPDVSNDENRDVLMSVFGIPAEDLTDDEGAFCDTRVLAGYRLRLSELQQRCDPIMRVVAERPPSVFTAVSAVRDLATSASPFITLLSAREIRTRILSSFDMNPELTRTVLADAAREGDEEWTAFGRLQECLHRAERARNQTSGIRRDYAIAVLEAYRHMAEGITRRWVQVLLRLSGLDDPPRTIGALGPPAIARLGNLGTRIEAALIPMVRNAEAHDDFSFDEDTGLLMFGDMAFDPSHIVDHLGELDVLQRALIVGRLAAFADQPELAAENPSDATAHSSASSALSFARQRFGHAGQRVRKFDRDRDRLNIALDTLRAEACNPCFVALTQTAQVLPTVARFMVWITGRDTPIIDLPGSVLHENWKVFLLAAKWFPDALPQETFLPCLTWARLACEPVGDATRACAWLALNGACHAILDAEADPAELRRLPGRFRTIVAATSSTMRLLPEGRHLDPLDKVQRLTLATGNVFARDPHGISTGVLTDHIFGLRDSLGEPVAVLPTLDPTPLQEGSFPHPVS